MQKHPTIPGLYLSDEGELFYKLTPTTDGAGYAMVTVPRSNGVPIRERLHRLIWETVNGRAVPRGHCIRHLNDNRNDNRPENLEVGTQAENLSDMVQNGHSLKGEKNHQAIINVEAVKDIRQRRLQGESLKSIASEYGISVQSVCDIDKRRTWAHV